METWIRTKTWIKKFFSAGNLSFSTLMIVYLKFLVGGAFALVAFVFALKAVLYVMPPRLVEEAQWEIFGSYDYLINPYESNIANPPLRIGSADAEMEIRHADRSHQTVLDWIATCLNFSSVNELPPELGGQINPSGGYFPDDFGYEEYSDIDEFSQNEAEDKVAEDLLKTLPRLKQLANFSSGLTDQRYNISIRKDEVFESLQWFTLFAIFIGLLTTVVVSISTAKIFEGAKLAHCCPVKEK